MIHPMSECKLYYGLDPTTWTLELLLFDVCFLCHSPPPLNLLIAPMIWLILAQVPTIACVLQTKLVLGWGKDLQENVEFITGLR